MRLLTLLPLVLLCSVNAHAMQIDVRNQDPIIIAGSMTYTNRTGAPKTVSAPWIRQELNILNTDPNYSLRLDYMTAAAACLDSSNETYDLSIFADFDTEDMSTLPPIGPGQPGSVGEFYLAELPTCRNGVAVVIDLSGSLIDANGDDQDFDDSSILFIAR